jgi:hypothetical protein
VISVKANTAKVDIALDNLMKQMPQKVERALKVTAMIGINIIQDRTAKGVGIKGPFAKYSTGYAKAKAVGWPSGERRTAFSGDPSGIVNLNVSGQMTGGMSVKAKGFSAQIYFPSALNNNKAFWNQYMQKSPRYARPFFGFNDQEKRTLAKQFQKAFKV